MKIDNKNEKCVLDYGHCIIEIEEWKIDNGYYSTDNKNYLLRKTFKMGHSKFTPGKNIQKYFTQCNVIENCTIKVYFIIYGNLLRF